LSVLVLENKKNIPGDVRQQKTLGDTLTPKRHFTVTFFFVLSSRNGEVRTKTIVAKLLVRRLHRIILDGYAQRLCSYGDPTDSTMPYKTGRRRDV
jgi:hypothetical protein